MAGGRDFFSNGIHLNVIEAAEDPAAESWENLNAIDDLVGEIINTGSHLVMASLEGEAAAGGVPLALAADRVYAREDAVLNPYYGHMGGLYGSEYWTYLLPRRVGPQVAAELTRSPFTPLSAAQALRIGLIDSAFGLTADAFRARLIQHAQRLAGGPDLESRLELKRTRRADDERARPLADYRKHELERCHACFFGPDRSYHDATGSCSSSARRAPPMRTGSCVRPSRITSVTCWRGTRWADPPTHRRPATRSSAGAGPPTRPDRAAQKPARRC